MSSSRLAGLAALGMAALQAVLLVPLFSVPGPPPGDLSVHLPEIEALARSIAAADPGLWNPSSNLGYPSGFYYQVLPQLVPALAFALSGGSISLLLLFKIAVALPVVLLPLTAYRGLSVAGLGRAEALAAALAISSVSAQPIPRLLWGVGLDSLVSYGLYSQAWATLFYPLALGFGSRFLREGRDPVRALVYPLLTGLCHPFMGVAAGLALLLQPWWRRDLRGSWLRAPLLFAGVMACSAFFWLPILVYYDSFGGFPGTRLSGERGIQASVFLQTMLGGGLLDARRLPLLSALSLAALAHAALRRRGPLAWLSAQALLFGVPVTLGPSVGALPDDLIPAIRFLAPLQLALAAAAGGIAARLGLAAWHWIALRPSAQARRALGILLVASSAAVVAAVVEGSRRKAGELLPPLLERLDPSHWMQVHTRQDLADLERLRGALAGLPPGRVLTSEQTGFGRALLGWWEPMPGVGTQKPVVVGSSAAPLQSSVNFFYVRRRVRPDVLRTVFNVRYLIARDAELVLGQWPEARRLAGGSQHALYELPPAGFFSPIRLLGGGVLPPDQRRPGVLAWLASDGAARGEHFALDGGPESAGPPEGRVLQEGQGPSLYRADVDVSGSQPTTFVLKVTYHPGWSVRIDGEPGRVRRVSPDFLAVDVPPGRHGVEFVFRRPYWSWILLGASLLVLAVLAGVRAR